MINVIVPMYNSANYIRRCVDSIIDQTYTNWNLVLVDDGSRDESLSIAQAYSSKDSRISVLHQENRGAGAARNLALENIVGGGVYSIH